MTIDDIKALIAADVEIHYVDVPDRPGNKVIAMHFDGCLLYTSDAADER